MVQLADALPSNVGIVLDSFHWYTSSGTVDEVRTLLSAGATRIVCVHLNDARPGRSREEQRDGERDLPGATGVIDLRGLVAVLDEIGYDGPAIAEPFQPQRDRLGALPPDEAAAEVAATMRRAFGRGAEQ
jgi:sugar phosphate isomerase/epimerase